MARHRFTLLAACLMVLGAHRPAEGCGFIESSRFVVTAHDDAVTCKFMLYGKLENARLDGGKATTDFVVTDVLKNDPVIVGRKVFQLPWYVPNPDPKKPLEFVILGDMTDDGKPDVFRGFQASRAWIGYLKGSLAIDAKDRVKTMRYAFDYLEHDDRELANDAFNEFMKSPDADIRTVARTLPPDNIRRWIQDERTKPSNLRLYGYLLGNCGKQEDAALLRKLLDRLMNDSPGQIDGILTGYTILKPVEGWAYTRDVLKGNDFSVRYQALRSARYFMMWHLGVVADEEFQEVLGLALGQPDIADIPIDYLRQGKYWKLTDRILPLFEKKDADPRKDGELRLVRRAIVRYALQCPDAQAARLVVELRKTEPELVKDTKAWLEAEERKAQTPAP